MHFVKNYRSLSVNNLRDKISAVYSELYDYGFKIRKYDKIVTLTHEDREKNWRNDTKVVVLDGVAWEYIEHSNGTEVWKRDLDYIYGIEPLENITNLLNSTLSDLEE